MKAKRGLSFNMSFDFGAFFGKVKEAAGRFSESAKKRFHVRQIKKGLKEKLSRLKPQQRQGPQPPVQEEAFEGDEYDDFEDEQT